ncbi:Coenzyme A disulfide reductase [Planctomycetes bacterium Pan216]|uniref:Coenzyme A disulfide reductase n=1 Tax=Kolteria novifilia TaxID=2527975 RepID=A0A518BD51_9BACT|nr:Coenzyme A disulfide reductase [Planctomycetes bacterium Pan216]
MKDHDSPAQEPHRIVIVGAVAGGASAAARLRRLGEHSSIVVFERGEHASFANCGLPYYLGGEIVKRDKLLVAGKTQLEGWLNLEIRTRTDVLSIDRERKLVHVRDLATGDEYDQPYDQLILSPGASPIRPAALLEKVRPHHPRVKSLRSLGDADRLKELVDSGISSAVIVGGGFIGLEVAEQLGQRKVTTSLIEATDHVMPALDKEITAPIHETLTRHGVRLHLNVAVADLEPLEGDRIRVRLDDDRTIETDLVVLAIGVRPESLLAKNAGLELNDRGAIRVDAHQRTSDPSIYAVGDAVEVTEPVFGNKAYIPLGGPANRQGRLAADHIAATVGVTDLEPEELTYRGSQGTSIVRVFDVAAGLTGQSEISLQRQGKRLHEDYETVTVHPMSHASYYPGAQRMTLKIMFSKKEGRLLGAEAVGRHGIDKRLDVLAMAIQLGGTVFDLEQAELCYAPPFGSAKDPINMAGFQAANLLLGQTRNVNAKELEELIKDNAVTLLDVRTEPEYQTDSIEIAVNIPLDQLRERRDEIPRDRPVVTYCQVGQRGYLAETMLRQHGVDVRNLSGGFTSWRLWQAMVEPPNEDPIEPNPGGAPSLDGEEQPSKIQTQVAGDDDAASGGKAMVTTSCQVGGGATNNGQQAHAEPTTLDVRGELCPGPLLAMAHAVEQLRAGQSIRVLASDPGFANDARAWCASNGHRVLEVQQTDRAVEALIQKQTAGASQEVATTSPRDGQTLVVFSGDLDKVLASFVIANGAAAMGKPVTMFFTFWGLNALRRKEAPPVSKGLLDRMFGWMMPRGAERLKLSQMNMGGMGTAMMKYVMKNKNVADLPTMIATARQQGVRMVACTMSMDVMGLKKEELIDGVELGGVAAYLGEAQKSSVNLFV